MVQHDEPSVNQTNLDVRWETSSGISVCRLWNRFQSPCHCFLSFHKPAWLVNMSSCWAVCSLMMSPDSRHSKQIFRHVVVGEAPLLLIMVKEKFTQKWKEMFQLFLSCHCCYDVISKSVTSFFSQRFTALCWVLLIRLKEPFIREFYSWNTWLQHQHFRHFTSLYI